jgi:hypothetical protein
MVKKRVSRNAPGISTGMKILILLVGFGFITALVYILISLAPEENRIGGDRDEHGCLTAAGYSWNADEQACVREWIDGEGRYQVTDFQTCADAGYPVMESYPRRCRAPNEEIFTEDIQ